MTSEHSVASPSRDTVPPEVARQFPHLFEPLTIGNIHIRNRVFVSSHTTMLAKDGGPSEELIAFLGAKAQGGVGMIVTEAVNVHPSGTESTVELCGWEPKYAEGLRRLRKRLDQHGTVMFVQLFHSGGGGTHAGMMEKGPNLQPSNIPLVCEGLIGTNHEMDLSDIEAIIQGFADTALVSKDNGAQGVQVAAAHGYLIHRFLTPLHNRRTDRYGGSFDKRLNFLRDILTAVREKVGDDFPVGARIGCNDFLEDSLSHEDMVRICKTLDDEKLVDYFDVTGTHEFILRSLVHHYGVMDDKAGHMVPLAGNIENAVSVPVLHAGRIINPRQAEDILAAGHVDMVGMTRASIADPDFMRKTAEQRETDIIYCVGCGQACMGRVNRNEHVTCIQNPMTGREHVWGEPTRAPQPKRIVVVGGGPAGMAFAWQAGVRGHHVSLYDNHHELGGQVLLAEQLPLCLELGSVARNMARQVHLAGVDVHLKTTATCESIAGQNPDEVVLATGSIPYLPREVPGIDQDHVFTMERAFAEPDRLGKSVLLVDNDGHHKGTSTAAWLLRLGKKLQVATEFSHVGCHHEMAMFRMRIYQQFFKQKVPLHPHMRLTGVGRRSAQFKDVFGATDIEIGGIDSVIVIYPSIARTDLEKQLRAAGVTPHLIGDCLSPRNIETATFFGAKLGRQI